MNVTKYNKNDYRRWSKNNSKPVAFVCGSLDSTALMFNYSYAHCLVSLYFCRTKNVHGDITVNGRPRELKRFRRQAAYIMQDHELQPFITVMEAMHFSANLKIGGEMSQVDKKCRVSAWSYWIT